MIIYNKAESLPQIDEFVAMERSRLTPAEALRYNAYRLRYEANPVYHALDHFPPNLQIEPTSVCNYRCTFCYQTDETFTDKANGHMGLMKLDLFKKIIDEAEGKCEAVNLASRGEPLLHPQIADFLAYANNKFLALKLNTNGWFLDERLCHAILSTNMNTLVISADAASEPTYSQLRVGGTFLRIMQNVRRFRAMQRRDYPTNRTLLRISGVKVPGTPELKVMDEVWGEIADQVCFVNYLPWENTYDRPINDIDIACSDLWRRMFVWFDGTVNPCDVDFQSHLAVGKFPDQTLSDLWLGQKYTMLRTMHLQGQRHDCGPCNRCTVI